MSTVAISQLPVAGSSSPTDEIPIVQGGITKRITNALLFSTTSLASASGLPIVAGTTGTLTVARGGTGVTTSTGAGSVVLSNSPSISSPTLATPILGVATATSINKVAITAPATSATLTIADGKTLTVSHSLTLAGTDSTTMTFPSTSASIARTDAAQTFTGNQTVNGAVIGNVQSLSGAGAVDVTSFSTAFTSTATGNALTLANGTVGQVKIVAYVAEAAGADTGILTPTTRVGYSTITFTNVGDCVTLQYFTQGWAVIGVRGATVA
jgi:hypothetical protein